MRHPCASTGKTLFHEFIADAPRFTDTRRTNTLTFKSFRIIYSNLNFFPDRISSIQTVRSHLSYLIVLRHWKSKLIDWSVDFKYDFEENCWSTMTRYATWPEIKPLGSVSIQRIPILLEPVRRQRLPTYMYTHTMYTMRCDATRRRRTPRRCTPMPVPGNFNN